MQSNTRSFLTLFAIGAVCALGHVALAEPAPEPKLVIYKIVTGEVDPETGEIATHEEIVSSHVLSKSMRFEKTPPPYARRVLVVEAAGYRSLRLYVSDLDNPNDYTLEEARCYKSALAKGLIAEIRMSEKYADYAFDHTYTTLYRSGTADYAMTQACDELAKAAD